MPKPIHLFLSAVLLAAINLHAQVVYRWDVDLAKPQPADLDVWRGETISLQPRFISYRQPWNITTNATVKLYWSTNHFATAPFATNASISATETGRVSAIWNNGCDAGASTYDYFIGVSQPDGLLYRARGTLTMHTSPGWNPPPGPIPLWDGWTNNYVYASWGAINATSNALAAALQSGLQSGSNYATAVGANAITSAVAQASAAVPALVTAGMSGAISSWSLTGTVASAVATNDARYLAALTNSTAFLSVTNADVFGTVSIRKPTEVPGSGDNYPWVIYRSENDYGHDLYFRTTTGTSTWWNLPRLPGNTTRTIASTVDIATSLSNVSCVSLGAVATNDARYLAALTNAAAFDTTGLAASASNGAIAVSAAAIAAATTGVALASQLTGYATTGALAIVASTATNALTNLVATITAATQGLVTASVTNGMATWVSVTNAAAGASNGAIAVSAAAITAATSGVAYASQLSGYATTNGNAAALTNFPTTAYFTPYSISSAPTVTLSWSNGFWQRLSCATSPVTIYPPSNTNTSYGISFRVDIVPGTSVVSFATSFSNYAAIAMFATNSTTPVLIDQPYGQTFWEILPLRQK